ncbi:MAG: hypothetical protein RJA10_3179 [Pseudomonadota bacterium]
MKHRTPLARRAVCLLLALAPTWAWTQATYPARPVTVVVTMAPGGTTDIVGRLIAQKLQERLGGSFVVDNKAGAGGNIGSVAVAKAAADGHTLMVQLSSTQVINPALYKSTGFDPIKDFAPISPLVKVPYALIVHPKSDVQSVAALLAKAKAAGDKPMQFGSAGSGTPNHLLGELLATKAGLALAHIPYKGAAAATQAVAAGEVPFAFVALPTTMGQIKSGLVKALGVSSTEPLAVLPDVPPIARTVPGFSGDAWVGLLAPAGTPVAIVERLNGEVKQILAQPEVRERLAASGATPYALTSSEFLQLIRSELPLWAEVVKRSGATVD